MHRGFAWSKYGYEPYDALLRAVGGNVRVPEIDEVQKFVDTASTGDYEVAGSMATEEAM